MCVVSTTYLSPAVLLSANVTHAFDPWLGNFTAEYESDLQFGDVCLNKIGVYSIFTNSVTLLPPESEHEFFMGSPDDSQVQHNITTTHLYMGTIRPGEFDLPDDLPVWPPILVLPRSRDMPEYCFNDHFCPVGRGPMNIARDYFAGRR